MLTPCVRCKKEFESVDVCDLFCDDCAKLPTEKEIIEKQLALAAKMAEALKKAHRLTAFGDLYNEIEGILREWEAARRG